jgi:hypothetical protein
MKCRVFALDILPPAEQMRDAKPGLAHLRPPAGTIVDDNRVCQGQTSLLIRKGVNVRNYLVHFGRAIWRCARPVTTLLRAYTAVGDRPRTPDEPDKSIKVSPFTGDQTTRDGRHDRSVFRAINAMATAMLSACAGSPSWYGRSLVSMLSRNF